MSSAILIRTGPQVNEDTKESKISDSNQNPTSYPNLTIGKKINKGKFPVYLTCSKSNDKQYALKMFSDAMRDYDDYYKNEVRFASLDHPNIIRIINHENQKAIVHEREFKRVSYILSEYAPHGDLLDFIACYSDEVDDKLIRTYFRQLIEGIEYLHGKGVAHLDLKPQNLLLDADFNLKIADFDLSYMAGDEKIRSKGTRYYRAPEFFNNATTSKIDLEMPFAADIYSAGIILFALKSGGVYPHWENHGVDGLNLLDLMDKNNSKFWSVHCEMQKQGKAFFDSKFKDLFNQMVKSNPKQRLSIKKIKASKWYNGPVYTASELRTKMNTIFNS